MQSTRPDGAFLIDGAGAMDSGTDGAASIARNNLMVLATAPREVVGFRDGLIAPACARGRPPFIAVLTDGVDAGTPDPDRTAAHHARALRDATRAMGVPDDWLLILGLHGGTVPRSGPVFDAVVRALVFLLWRRDCTVLAMAASMDGSPDQAGCRAIARAVADVSAVRLLLYKMDGAATELSLG